MSGGDWSMRLVRLGIGSIYMLGGGCACVERCRGRTRRMRDVRDQRGRSLTLMMRMKTMRSTRLRRIRVCGRKGKSV